MRPSPVAAVPLLLALAGCGSLSDQFASSSVWVTPGKYTYYHCKQLQSMHRGHVARLKELGELMARAAQGPGGEAVGFMVYRTEYQQGLGERDAMVATMAEKRCQFEGDRASDRSVF